MPNWQMYTKKNTKNLNELSLLQTEKKKTAIWTTQWWSALFVHPRWIHLCRLPECSVKWFVPADEWTRCEEHEPDDGQAKVHPTCCVHAEPGHAAHQVSKQRPCMNWSVSTKREKNMHCKPWCITVHVRRLKYACLAGVLTLLHTDALL